MLHSRIQHLIPEPITLDDNIPFGEGRELIVNIQVDPRGTNDVYVDDIIPLTVGQPGTDNTARCASAALLAIHATTRESHQDDPSPQELWQAYSQSRVDRDKDNPRLGYRFVLLCLGFA